MKLLDRANYPPPPQKKSVSEKLKNNKNHCKTTKSFASSSYLRPESPDLASRAVVIISHFVRLRSTVMREPPTCRFATRTLLDDLIFFYDFVYATASRQHPGGVPLYSSDVIGSQTRRDRSKRVYVVSWPMRALSTSVRVRTEPYCAWNTRNNNRRPRRYRDNSFAGRLLIKCC